MGDDVTVRMWEVRAAPGAVDALVAWLFATALPALRAGPGHRGDEVFTSADERIVVISRWRGEPMPLPAPPVELLRRDPHSWDFTPVAEER